MEWAVRPDTNYSLISNAGSVLHSENSGKTQAVNESQISQLERSALRAISISSPLSAPCQASEPFQNVFSDDLDVQFFTPFQ